MRRVNALRAKLGKANFQPATQSTRRKRQQIRVHPKDKNAS